MLANDSAARWRPPTSRRRVLGRPQRAASRFLANVPSVGPSRAARVHHGRRRVLQSPTTDHALVRSALAQLRDERRHGDRRRAHDRAATTLRSVPRVGGKQPAGRDRAALGRRLERRLRPDHRRPQAAADAHPDLHGRSSGPPNGTITDKRGGKTVTVPVPPNPQQLAEIARVSHGQAFTASDATGLTPSTSASARARAQEGQTGDHRELRRRRAWCCCCSAAPCRSCWFGRLV